MRTPRTRGIHVSCTESTADESTDSRARGRRHGGLWREQHPDPRRTGGRAQAPGHVHRRHAGRHRPASHGVRGRRQLGRRGAGRPLRRHRRHDPHRQLDLRGRQRARHPHRHQVRRQARTQALGGRDRADRAARRRQVQPEQLQGLGRAARRRRLVRQRTQQVAAADDPPRRPGARARVPPGRGAGPAGRDRHRAGWRGRDLADEDHRPDRQARHRSALPAR